MPFLTPVFDETMCLIRADVWIELCYVPYIYGALEELTDPENWEKLGNTTPEGTAYIFRQFMRDLYAANE